MVGGTQRARWEDLCKPTGRYNRQPIGNSGTFRRPNEKMNVLSAKIFMPRVGFTFFQHLSPTFSLERLPDDSLALDMSILLLASLILVYLLQSMATSYNKSNKACPTSLDPTQALHVVFTPTSVAWPVAFVSHFRSARTSGRQLELSLSELFDNIFQGRIEMRNYHDLPDLFQGLRAYSWCMKFGLDGRWYFKTAKWLAAQHIFSTCSDVSLSQNYRL